MFSAKKEIGIKEVDRAFIKMTLEEHREFEDALKNIIDIMREIDKILPDARYSIHADRSKLYDSYYSFVDYSNRLSYAAICEFNYFYESVNRYISYLTVPKVLEEMLQKSKEFPKLRQIFSDMDKHLKQYETSMPKLVPMIEKLKEAVRAYAKLVLPLVLIDPAVTFSDESIDAYFFRKEKVFPSRLDDLNNIFTSEFFKSLHDKAHTKLIQAAELKSESRSTLSARPA